MTFERHMCTHAHKRDARMQRIRAREAPWHAACSMSTNADHRYRRNCRHSQGHRRADADADATSRRQRQRRRTAAAAAAADAVMVVATVRLPFYLPNFLPSYLPTSLPSYMYLPTSLTCYLPTFLPSYLPTFLPSYLPTTPGAHSHHYQ